METSVLTETPNGLDHAPVLQPKYVRIELAEAVNCLQRDESNKSNATSTAAMQG